jgi:hypothetical protein
MATLSRATFYATTRAPVVALSVPPLPAGRRRSFMPHTFLSAPSPLAPLPPRVAALGALLLGDGRDLRASSAQAAA